MRVEKGLRGVSVAHCAVVGNAGGGVVSTTLPVHVAANVSWLQSMPFPGAVAHAGYHSKDPLAAPFVRAPDRFAAVLEVDGDVLQLDAAPDLQAVDRVELADDGVDRDGTVLPGERLRVSPPPAGVPTPARLAVLPGGDDAAEDWSLSPGSPALGAGLFPPAAPAEDAGPFGAPSPAAPGVEEDAADFPFVPLARAPELVPGPTAQEPITLTFGGGVPDATSLGPSALAAFAEDGSELAITYQLLGEELVISPPLEGWPKGATLELYSGLRATNGASLAAPLVLLLALTVSAN